MSRKRTDAHKNHKWDINQDIVRVLLLSCKSVDAFLANTALHDQNIVVSLLVACLQGDGGTRNQMVQLLEGYLQSDMVVDEWKCVLGLILSSLSILKAIQPTLQSYATQIETNIRNTLITENLGMAYDEKNETIDLI